MSMRQPEIESNGEKHSKSSPDLEGMLCAVGSVAGKQSASLRLSGIVSFRIKVLREEEDKMLDMARVHVSLIELTASSFVVRPWAQVKEKTLAL